MSLICIVQGAGHISDQVDAGAWTTNDQTAPWDCCPTIAMEIANIPESNVIKRAEKTTAIRTNDSLLPAHILLRTEMKSLLVQHVSGVVACSSRRDTLMLSLSWKKDTWPTAECRSSLNYNALWNSTRIKYVTEAASKLLCQQSLCVCWREMHIL